MIIGSDGNVRYYEYENDALFPLAEHKSTDPQRGMCFLPRRALSISDCEIARAYKIYGAAVEPIGFIVPRKVGHRLFSPYFTTLAYPHHRQTPSSQTSTRRRRQTSRRSPRLSSSLASLRRPST